MGFFVVVGLVCFIALRQKWLIGRNTYSNEWNPIQMGSNSHMLTTLIILSMKNVLSFLLRFSSIYEGRIIDARPHPRPKQSVTQVQHLLTSPQCSFVSSFLLMYIKQISDMPFLLF